MPKKDPCKRFACKIQDCLSANDYQVSACKEVFEEMRQCCIKWKQESFVCDGVKTETPYTISSKT